MNWKTRLLGIALAGGSVVAGAACSSQGGVGGGPCNANPDPCCNQPDSARCKDGKSVDAGDDAESDAPVDAAGDGSASDAAADRGAD